MTYYPFKHHRRSIHLKGYDYSQAGMYFIIICCQDRTCRFGCVENGKMVLNEFGIVACNEWMRTTEIRNNVELGEFVIMPNHIHGIVRILAKGELHSLVKTNELYSPVNRGVCDTPLRSPSQTIGAIVRGYKSLVAKQLKLLGFNEKLWQRNYHEHIIRKEQS